MIVPIDQVKIFKDGKIVPSTIANKPRALHGKCIECKSTDCFWMKMEKAKGNK